MWLAGCEIASDAGVWVMCVHTAQAEFPLWWLTGEYGPVDASQDGNVNRLHPFS